ncbi:MAG TPA: hypothetical protein VFX70_06350 [Mycobacteriales bacterium]|nr:hypothetical protein [Mycobacteriales bacterium]
MTRPGPLPWPGHAGRDVPTDEQYVAYARQVLAWHRPVPPTDGRAPHWCTCGSALVLCPYRSAAARYLDPPAPGAG